MALPSIAGSDERESVLRRACGLLRPRVMSGEERAVEALLAEYRELAEDPDAALELIYTEFVLREELGQPLPQDAWRERFPQWADALARLIEVHRELHRGEQEDTGRAAATWPPYDKADSPGAESLPAESGNERYELVEEIARGGMGVVYRARQPALDRDVALKVILAGEFADPAVRQRFIHEARTTARLAHPRIVQVFDVGELAGQPYLAMEYLPGGSLADRLAAGPLTPPVAANLVAALARAIDYAHRQGVVHRDLKPANILLRSPDADLDDFKIADFGLAKAARQEGDHSGAPATGSAALMGTPSYMAPEQAAEAREIGPRTDVYALGAILYEALVGRPPYRGNSPLETLQQVVALDVVPPSRLQPNVPRDLETICLVCLAKDPARRYATAAALADDLARHLAGRPIVARPAGILERGAKWCRRRPAVALLLALVLLLALASFVTVTALWRSAVVALAEKEAARRRAEDSLAEKLVALAELAWRNNDLPAARRHLAEVASPKRGPAWQALQRACLAQRHVLSLDSGISAIAISSDGKLVAASSASGTLAVWELATGQERWRVWRAGKPGSWASLGFTEGGLHIVRAASFSSSPSTGIPDLLEWRTFDAATGRRTAMHTVRGRHSLIKLSGGSHYLAACEVNSQALCLWDTGSGQSLWRLPQSFASMGSAFSADESQLYFAMTDRSIRRLDVSTGQTEAAWTGGATGRSPLALDRDGKRLAVALHENSQLIDIQVRTATDGQVIGQFTTTHALVADLSLDRSGERVATCSPDGTIVVWQAASGRKLLTLRGHTAEIDLVAFSPDDQTLVSGGRDHTVRVWDVGAN